MQMVDCKHKSVITEVSNIIVVSYKYLINSLSIFLVSMALPSRSSNNRLPCSTFAK
jgi:hypothetical protein